MNEFEMNVAKLVLKEVSEFCKKTRCEGCPFTIVKQLRDDKKWFDCRISREPHLWDIEEGEE